MLIYKITNRINGMCYIGQTKRTLKERIYDHFSLADDLECTRYLYNAIRKYGKDNFDYEQIDTASTVEELTEREDYWIVKLNTLFPNGYNMVRPVMNPMDSEIVIQKHLKRVQSKENREKISKSMKLYMKTYGVSQETRDKLSRSMQGNKNGLGKKRPQSAIDSTSRKHFKAVYCVDENGNILAEFESVQSGAKWWAEKSFPECIEDYWGLSNDIKRSSVKDVYIKGIKWYYK